MSRLRRVKHLFDNRDSQGRWVVQFECNHYTSVGLMEAQTTNGQRFIRDAQAGQAMCDKCQAPTVQETRASKSPQRLWKEAGEP